MDKTDHPELKRKFLIEQLPDPLTRASKHIQIFDNYIANTQMRLRSIRIPESRDWTYVLQKRTRAPGSLSNTKLDEIILDKAEHERFEIFCGNEIRKNRYAHAFDGRAFVFDVYLGNLWGLSTARVDFETRNRMENFIPPPFAIFEVTNDAFFNDENLVGKKFTDVQAEVEQKVKGVKG